MPAARTGEGAAAAKPRTQSLSRDLRTTHHHPKPSSPSPGGGSPCSCPSTAVPLLGAAWGLSTCRRGTGWTQLLFPRARLWPRAGAGTSVVAPAAWGAPGACPRVPSSAGPKPSALGVLAAGIAEGQGRGVQDLEGGGALVGAPTSVSPVPPHPFQFPGKAETCRLPGCEPMAPQCPDTDMAMSRQCVRVCVSGGERRGRARTGHEAWSEDGEWDPRDAEGEGWGSLGQGAATRSLSCLLLSRGKSLLVLSTWHISTALHPSQRWCQLHTVPSPPPCWRASADGLCPPLCSPTLSALHGWAWLAPDTALTPLGCPDPCPIPASLAPRTASPPAALPGAVLVPALLWQENSCWGRLREIPTAETPSPQL